VLDDDGVWKERFRRRWGLKEVWGDGPAKKSFYRNASEQTFVRKVPVKSTDTIASIAVKSGTSLSLLKQVNNLSSDSSLYCRSEIYIPVSDGVEVSGASVVIRFCPHTLREYAFLGCEVEGEEGTEGEEVVPLEQAKREKSDNGRQAELMLNLMARSLKIDESSARFYLETSDYDLKEAMASYKTDEQWEQDQKLFMKSSKKSSQAKAPSFCCY
jgi:LysM repeat protein